MQDGGIVKVWKLLDINLADKYPFGTLNISTFSVSLLKADNHKWIL